MSAPLRIAGPALIALAIAVMAIPVAASPWNTPTPVTGAQAQDPSESGTDGLREDEPEPGPQGEDPRRGGADGEEPAPGDDFGCPIQNQESFEMII